MNRSAADTLLAPEVAFHLKAIRELCVEFGVLTLEVFGSASDGTFDPVNSDVDFIAEFPDGYDYGPWGARLWEFEDRLADLLDRPVDVISGRQMRNPYFIRSVNRSRRLLYES